MLKENKYKVLTFKSIIINLNVYVVLLEPHSGALTFLCALFEIEQEISSYCTVQYMVTKPI